MKRYEKKLVLELEAPDAITFEVLNGKNGKVIIKANIDQSSFCAQNCSKQTDSLKETEIQYVDPILKENYTNPPIPSGYIHIRGKWKDGFVIERESDESQFVWIPVGFLKPNGTLDGHSFNSKFGRRRYYEKTELFSKMDFSSPFNTKLLMQIDDSEIFSRKNFYEPITDELALQIKSIEKYGGFYISRYNISMSKYGKPQSKRCKIPLECTRNEIFQLASSFENTDTIKSHLIYGSEYDSVLEWFMESNKLGFYSIAIDSSSWGNYYSEKKQQNNYSKEKVPQLTGISDTWCVNRLYDFAGNVTELTQEEYNFSKANVYRGGNFENSGKTYAAATRNYHKYIDKFGFHIALYLKP